LTLKDQNTKKPDSGSEQQAAINLEMTEVFMDTGEFSSSQAATPSSRILVVTKSGNMTRPVMEYAINVAERLKCKLLAAYVNAQPLLWNDNEQSRVFTATMKENVAFFKAMANARGVELTHVQENGKIDKVISRLCHIVKRVEFVVIDKGIRLEEATACSPVPVFHIACTEQQATVFQEQNRQLPFSSAPTVGTIQQRSTSKTSLSLLGAAVVAADAALPFTTDYLRDFWQLGGIHLALPAAALLVLVAAHTALIGNIFQLLKKDQQNAKAQSHECAGLRPMRKRSRSKALSRIRSNQ
jgi:hypothetical protein